jgi:hypothetical protein
MARQQCNLADMPYRYWMHCYTDPEAPLQTGRVLTGRSLAEAVEQAAELWDEGTYPSATGCCVVDTEDGTIPWRGECRPSQSPTSRTAQPGRTRSGS